MNKIKLIASILLWFLIILIIIIIPACLEPVNSRRSRSGSHGSNSNSGINNNNGNITKYSLIINISPEGSGTTTPNNGTYNAGDMIKLTAIENKGSVFHHWEGDIKGNSNPITFSMDSNKNITAVFELIKQNLATNIIGQGQITQTMKSKGVDVYNYGATIELNAIPAIGWKLDHWEGDLTGSENIKSIVMNGDKTVTAVFVQLGEVKYKWNFLVYLDGDNNLERYAIIDINEMEKIGSTADVNILVLVDRSPVNYDTSNGNWTGTRLYKITKDADTSVITSELQTASPWGKSDDSVEAQMNNPNTLRDFIVYCQNNYPAQRTVLTLWNHGGGVYPKSMGKKQKGSSHPENLKTSIGVKGICWDDTSGTSSAYCLSTADVANALSQARQATGGQKIEIINMDACLMQMLEVAYEWKDKADYLVGSEETVPLNGNAYDIILNHLTNNPDMSTENLAIVLVDDYYSYYNGFDSTTYSAIKLSNIPGFMDKFKTFAARLNTSTTSSMQAIWDSGYNSTYYDYDEVIDLYDFAVHIEKGVNNYPDLVATAEAMKNAINSMVIHHRETGNYANDSDFYSYGVAICLPYNIAKYNKYPVYGTLLSSVDTEWNEFIYKNAYWGTNGSLP